MMTVACEPFDFASEDTNNDRISFEWTNAPEGAAKQFRREWFQVPIESNHRFRPLIESNQSSNHPIELNLQGDGMVRRKNLPMEYNP